MTQHSVVQKMIELLRASWSSSGNGIEGDRQAFAALARQFPQPEHVAESRLCLNGVPAIVSTPFDMDHFQSRVVLYLHGGAFLIGSAAIYRRQSAQIAVSAGATVATVDYRLAPEYPYPAALDDTLSAYLSLLDLGLGPDQVVIAGDSAGGNLALAAVMKLRDEGLPIPAGLILISPWVDLTCSGESMDFNANPQHLAQKSGLLASAKSFLDGSDPNHPYASPLFGLLAGLPPMLIQVGALETLLSDSIALERRSTASGNTVCLQVFDDMVHEWHLLSSLLPEDMPLDAAISAIADIGAFVHEVTK